MTKATTNRFARMDGTGETVEYRTPAYPSSTLAYLDYTIDGERASAEIFYPYKGTSRRYAERPAAAAEQIATRHINKEGYEA